MWPITGNSHFLIVSALFAALSPFLAGCQEPAHSNSAHAATNQPRTASSLTVQSDPQYLDASKRFQAKDFTGARTQLQAIAARPKLSAADSTFVQRQLDICEEAITGKPSQKVEAAISPRTSTPTPSPDCGPRALQIVAKELGIKADLETLKAAAGTGKEGTALEGLKKAAVAIGLKAEGVQMDKDALAHLNTPSVAWWEGNHYVAVLRVSQSALTGEVTATVNDPSQPKSQSVPLADLLAKSGGIILKLKKDPS